MRVIGKPVDFFTRIPPNSGLHLVPIPFTKTFADYYTLGEFETKDYPSLVAEGGPTVAIEAHAVGTPVIGTRIGGLAELVTDGVNGRLVAPGDVQPLVQGWLGEGVSLEFRLSEAGDEGPTARPPAPEEHPFVQAAVRKLEGKVTRVREISR